MARSALALLLLLAPAARSAVVGRGMPAAIVRLHQSSRALALTFLYEGMLRGVDPLTLLEDETHEEWFFSGNVSATLESAAEDLKWGLSGLSLPPPPPPSTEAAAVPLLANRAERARVKTRVLPADLMNTLSLHGQLPEGAEQVGEDTADADVRGRANEALCKQKLEAVGARRPELEDSLRSLLGAHIAPSLPALDVCCLLLMMAELHEGLPLPVAASEAIALSRTYGDGGEEGYHRHVHGVLASYAREYLKLEA